MDNMSRKSKLKEALRELVLKYPPEIAVIAKDPNKDIMFVSEYLENRDRWSRLVDKVYYLFCYYEIRPREILKRLFR